MKTKIKNKCPTFSFNKNAAKYIVNLFGRTFDEDGYVTTLGNKRVKCGVCKQPFKTDHLAGLIKNIGFICNNTTCLISISGKLNNDYLHIRRKK